jgi:hypothetical protein
MSNTTSPTKAAPADRVVGYHGPAPMDLSVVKVKTLATKKEKDRGKEGFV